MIPFITILDIWPALVYLYLLQRVPNFCFKMMKLILAITLLAAATMAADDGTNVHGALIKEYCGADDAGRDAILVNLEGWCLAPAVSF